MTRFPPPGINRRQAVLGLSLSGLAATAKASADTPMQPSPQFQAPTLLPADKLCLLTPQAVEGPYHTDPKLQRNDITEGREGGAAPAPASARGGGKLLAA